MRKVLVRDVIRQMEYFQSIGSVYKFRNEIEKYKKELVK